MKDSARRPSMAENARTLVESERVGTLCTQSIKHPGFPFGSNVPYGLDQHGSPIFLLSSLAVHSKNIRSDAKAALLVSKSGDNEDVLDRARISLIGEVTSIPDDEELQIQTDYLQRHPKSVQWIGFGDFAFYRLIPIDSYMVAGFGAMQWIDGEAYQSANPDPIASAALGVITHMNEDHEDSLRVLVKKFGQVEPLFVRMTAVDRYGFDVDVSTTEGEQSVRISFDEPIVDPQETRKKFVDMVKNAEE